jgi:hypothetical protein
MAWAGYGKTQIDYGMFDIARSVDEAKRFTKCERIYHRGQELAWDGREILPMLMEKHGGIHIEERKQEALKRIFAIIMWGELAAWKTSAQLAAGLVPLEAKMAATSQAHDEARHFYVMHDYLEHIGYVPERMDRAPQALLDLVLETDSLVHKLLGMNLMIETLALTIFQTVRELDVEPVLTELMRYYERDEARHVGLGMQYLPSLMRGMNKRQVSRLLTFQCRLLFWALWELKTLEPEFEVLGLDPRVVLDRGRRKQLAALGEAFEALGIPFDRERNPVIMTMNGAVEFLFPPDENKGSRKSQFQSAWKAFWGRSERVSITEAFAMHAAHAIKTARGKVAQGESSI